MVKLPSGTRRVVIKTSGDSNVTAGPVMCDYSCSYLCNSSCSLWLLPSLILPRWEEFTDFLVDFPNVSSSLGFHSALSQKLRDRDMFPWLQVEWPHLGPTSGAVFWGCLQQTVKSVANALVISSPFQLTVYPGHTSQRLEAVTFTSSFHWILYLSAQDSHYHLYQDPSELTGLSSLPCNARSPRESW